MKEMWEAPNIKVQTFVVGEYALQGCYDYKAQMQCAIPGTGRNHEHYIGQDNTSASSNHGICGNLTEEFDVFGSKGYEVNNDGSTNYLRPIYDITIGEKIEDTSNLSSIYFGQDPGTNSGELTDGYYKATWWSEDLEKGTGKYFHWGLAIVSSVIQIFNRPNHS